MDRDSASQRTKYVTIFGYKFMGVGLRMLSYCQIWTLFFISCMCVATFEPGFGHCFSKACMSVATFETGPVTVIYS